MVEQSNIAKIFKALANEQRLKIFMMIYEGCCPASGGLEKAFTKTCSCMDLSRSTISHHFKELQNAGLIICEREGQMFRCKVNEKAIKSIRELFK
jgi:ArsR family transcriptional regulator